jgi:hypothetical protein
VRAPDGNIITVWRELSEDEDDSVPALFRALVRYRVTREAEALAARARVVSREEVIRGFILASSKVTRARNRKPMIDRGIDAGKHQADWDAD